jgi:hypothetical protein
LWKERIGMKDTESDFSEWKIKAETVKNELDKITDRMLRGEIRFNTKVIISLLPKKVPRFEMEWIPLHSDNEARLAAKRGD